MVVNGRISGKNDGYWWLMVVIGYLMVHGCLINGKWLFKVVEKMVVDGWLIVGNVYLMLVISWWVIEDIMPNAYLMLLIQWLMAMNDDYLLAI